MFKNTRNLLSKTMDDVKLLMKLPGKLEPFILVFSIVYQTYMFLTDKELAYLHLTLLILVAANYIFRILVGNAYDSAKVSIFARGAEADRKRRLKLTLKTEKRIFSIIKYSIRLFLIATSVVSIVREPSVIKILATMIIFAELAVEIIIFIIANILDRRFTALQAAFFEDLASVSEPIKTASETVRKTKDAIIDRLGGFFRRKRRQTEVISDTDYIESEDLDSLPAGKNR